MQRNQRYQIPKQLRQVSIWVHPEGLVVGSLFLSYHTRNGAGLEDPLAVLNEASPFVALQRHHPDELRFYNKQALVRIEYQDDEMLMEEGLTTLHCQLAMMDGSLLAGTVRHLLPPGRARLYDYLNLNTERFVRLYVAEGVCLVNKAYIVGATPLQEPSEGVPTWQAEATEIDATYYV
ncbi:MAG: hypothetical protein AB7N91_32290 [Candidatus Tectimicrobiota bacterium]